MSEESDLAATLKALEERLLDQDIRRRADQVAALLADDFVEIGASGRRFDKAAIIRDLASEGDWPEKLAITCFEARSLGDALALVLYRIDQTNTLRSSIWRKTESGWRIVFHQGTKAP